MQGGRISSTANSSSSSTTVTAAILINGGGGSGTGTGTGSSGHGKNSGGGGCKGGGGAAMRKGPWMAEEDEILLEYVRKHGPRDWSSLRSKGLLPRTGKSCRLRWVNKLKPDLKTGCKFSPEEERIVIELQAQFGNKWARIATYLPGRTDNDVKNFWSTRQKRLARILRTPLPANKSNNKNQQEKLPAIISSHDDHAITTSDPGPSSLDAVLFAETNSNSGLCNLLPGLDDDHHGYIQISPMPDHLVDSSSCLRSDLDTALPLLEPAAIHDMDPCLFQSLPSLQPQFGHFPQSLMHFPDLLPDGSELLAGLSESSFPDELVCQEPSPFIQFPEGLPFYELDSGQNGIKLEQNPAGTQDGFFDDLPPDMFDCLELPPPQLPPPASTSPASL